MFHTADGAMRYQAFHKHSEDSRSSKPCTKLQFLSHKEHNLSQMQKNNI